MPTPTEDLEGALPVFESQSPGDDPLPDPPPPPEDETPSQTPESPRRPRRAAPSSTTTTTSSSTTSSEPPAAFTLDDVQDAIGDFVGATFAFGGQQLNRLEIRRKRRPTTRWIATAEEVEIIGTTAERYLMTKLPEELVEADGAKVAVVGGLTIAGYLLRNLFEGADGAQIASAGPPPASGPAAPGAPRPAAGVRPAEGPPASRVHAQAPAATPPEDGPIDVISPAL